MIDLRYCSNCGGSCVTSGSCAACLLWAALHEVQPPDLRGTLVGPYLLGDLIGTGGVGLVYQAADTRPKAIRSRQKVALKLLAADVDAPDQLVREAQLAAAVEHEHILPVYEVGDHEGITYLTMKLVEGGPVKVPAASARDAAELALKIASAVRFAHRHGILHRDLKPANVLVDGDGRPFVTDFGLAEREELADGKVRAGTPAYMAPEIWEGKPATTLADVWSAGATLYELLTGHPPWAAPTLQQLHSKIAAEAPAPLTNVPADLAAICLRCLEKEPSRRYANMHELVNDLQRLLADEPVHARPLALPARSWRRARRHPVMAVLSTLLCFLAFAAVVVWLRGANAQQAAADAVDLAARHIAESAAAKFAEYKSVVERAALDPDIALTASDDDIAVRVCERLRERHIDAFSTWDIFNAEGLLVGRSPPAVRDNRGRSYHFRGYFRGAADHARRHHKKSFVSGAYQSEGDGYFEIGIAAPIYDEQDRWVGVLSGTLLSGSALGSIKLPNTRHRHLSAALIAPREREREWPTDGPDPEPIVILHPTLKRGEIRQGGNLLSKELGTGGIVRVEQVEGTPLSVLVRVAYDDASSF
jgi:hypothetical protein